MNTAGFPCGTPFLKGDTMTWKMIKEATLSKMFAAQDGVIDLQNNADYLQMMPYAANEAIQYLCSFGRRPRQSIEIEIEEQAKPQSLELKYELPNYWGNPEFYILEDDVPKTVYLNVIAGRVIIPASMKGTLIVDYDYTPSLISSSVADDDEIKLDDDAIVLLPLYIASELYKDEDMTMATYWRNEFETQAAVLQRKTPESLGGEFTSETGWV